MIRGSNRKDITYFLDLVVHWVSYKNVNVHQSKLIGKASCSCTFVSLRACDVRASTHEHAATC